MFCRINKILRSVLVVVLLIYADLGLVVLEVTGANLSAEQLVAFEAAIKKVNANFFIADSDISFIPEINLYKIIFKPRGVVFYLSQDARYFFYGDLIDLSNLNRRNWNVTESSIRSIRKQRLATFSTNKMFVFKPKYNWVKKKVGVITVFTDLDCSFGNRFHQEIEQLVQSGVEVRYLLFPRGGTDSEGYKKSVSAWCAKDRNKAFIRANNREVITPINCDHHPIQQHVSLGMNLGIPGTPSIILADGSMVTGYVKHDDLLTLIKDNYYVGKN